MLPGVLGCSDPSPLWSGAFKIGNASLLDYMVLLSVNNNGKETLKLQENENKGSRISVLPTNALSENVRVFPISPLFLTSKWKSARKTIFQTSKLGQRATPALQPGVF